MEYTQGLTVAIYIIIAIGCTLGAFATYKIYSKEDGLR